MPRPVPWKQPLVACLLFAAALSGAPQQFPCFAQQPPTVEDILAATRHSQDLLSDYRANCRTRQKWQYKPIIAASEMSLGENAPPKIIGWTKEADLDSLKSIRMDYTWIEKGTKFAGEFAIVNEMTPSSYKKKYAFDGHTHLALTVRGDSLQGVIFGPSPECRGMSELCITPDHFSSYFEGESLVYWLSRPKAEMTLTYADYFGRKCLLIDYANKDATFSNAKFWLDPGKNFATVAMERWDANHTGTVYKTTELIQAAGGVWLPLKAVKEFYFLDPDGSGKPVVYSTVEFELDPKTLAVNTDIPDSEFTFGFPQGTHLSNDVTGESSIVGGKPLKPEDSIDDFLRKAQSMPSSPVELRTGAAQATPSTEVADGAPLRSARPFGTTVAISIAVVLLALLFIVIFVQVAKRRNADAK